MAMAKKKTDLHCHILPAIDDGAKNAEVSLELLREEMNQGVKRIMFTPHFDPTRISGEEFVKRREESLSKLRAIKEFNEMNIEYKLGAEVYYTVDLGESDLDKLCFQGSKYVLIELPTQVHPIGMKSTFGEIISRGYIPIIAHVERYSYMLADPNMLYELVEMGCLAHMNAEAFILKTRLTSMINYFVRHGLVHFISSDCHSAHRRPPNLKQGFDILQSNFGEKVSAQLNDNAKIIFNGGVIDVDASLKKPKNIFGIWT